MMIVALALILSPLAFAGEAATDSVVEAPVVPTDSVPPPLLGPDLTGPPTWHGMVTNLPGDWMKYYRATFREEEIGYYGGIAVVTGVLVATDDRTYQFSKRLNSTYPTVKTLSNFFANDFGDGAAQMTLAAAYAAYGLTFSNDRALRTASQTVQALLSGGLVVQVLKHITGRESPYVSSSPTGIWRFFPNQYYYAKRVPHYDAFPSGHLCTSTSTVIVIAENYPEITWIRPVGYTLLGLIAVSMVDIGIHWYSDYPLALAIGYTFGMIAVHPNGYDVWHFGQDNAGSVKLSASPMPGGGAGLTASVNLR